MGQIRPDKLIKLGPNCYTCAYAEYRSLIDIDFSSIEARGPMGLWCRLHRKWINIPLKGCEHYKPAPKRIE